MNILLLSFLSASLLFGQEKPTVTIVDYSASHKDAIMSIAFESPEKFLAGYSVITRSGLPANMFEAQAKVEIAALFDKELNHTKVLVIDEKVVGFVEFHKSREMCVEDMQKQFATMGMPTFPDEQLSTMFPYLKKTKEECAEYIEIECLAVTKEFRHKGYGRMLLKYAIETAQEMYPEIKQVRLNVNTINEEGIKLYESEGFVKSEVQPSHLATLEALQYEKELN